MSTGAVIQASLEILSRAKPGLRRYTVEQLFAARRIAGAAWSPQGDRFAFITNLSGRYNLWTVPAAGGWPAQLTLSDQRQYSPAWSPDGRWIAYQSDYDGDEQWDLFIVSPVNGEVVNLTQTPDIAESGPAWSHDSRFLAYSLKPRTSSVYELALIDMETRQTRALTSHTAANLGNYGPVWSPDDRLIAFTQARADGKDSNVFLLDVAADAVVNLTPHEGEQEYSVADWSPDGRRLLITSNARGGYSNAALLEISTCALTWLTEGVWETTAGNFSPDGQRVTWTSNVEGNSEIFVHDLSTGRTETLPLAAGVNTLAGAESAFSRDGRLAYFHSGAASPGDLFVYDFATGGSRQITHSLVGGVRAEDMVEPYLVHYASPDGRKIPAFLYVPFNLAAGQPAPAIVYIHGGPTAQQMNGFTAGIQYLVNQGYVLIAPNYRGSTGYGKEFQDANRMDLGGGDLEDVAAAAKFVAALPFVDRAKIAVMGASYGGYLTMMAVTKKPERWAAGVAMVPFVNWFTEVENEDPLLRQFDLATMGDPVENRALWEERSPINFVDRIRAPLLVLAGAHDPRCPREEADQVAAAVRAQGGVVESHVYENEGHGFSRLENQIDAWSRIGEFFDHHLKGVV